MLAVLLPLCERAWVTAPPSQRALPPATLVSLSSQLGFEETACEPQPARALAAAQSWARTREGGAAAILASGSIYLVGELLSHAHELGLLVPSGVHAGLVSEDREYSRGTQGRGRS